MAAEVVVLVPGIMGSVLKDGAEIIWPGTPAELLFPYRKMPQLCKDNLDPVDVIRSVSISSQYDTLIDALATCGFRENGAAPTLAVCPYDWRKDNALAAERLASRMESIVQQHGNTVEITLLGHSMGGLVARYYLESGDFAGRAGLANVRRLIALGTPHRGAPLAIQAALGQVKRLFLNKEQVKTLANNPLFPALYQLMPPPGEPFAWDEDGSKRYAPVDIYAANTAATLGLLPAHLASAKQFHSKLNLAKQPKGVGYFFFAGSAHPTVSEVLVSLPQKRVRAQEREDAGDGTVPVWSATQSGVQMAPVNGEHGDIYKDGLLQQILAVLLGKAGVLAAKLPKAELALRDTVVVPGAETRALLAFHQPVAQVEGLLQLMRLLDQKGKKVAAATKPVFSKTVRYSGAPIDRLSLQLKAPDIPGLYRAQFVQKKARAPAAKDDLFVQDDSP